MIIDRFSHSALARGEQIIVYQLSWHIIARFGVAVPDSQLPSPVAIQMSKSFQKFNKEMDEAEKSNDLKLRPKEKIMIVGQRVKIKDNHMTQAWGIANEVGVITEPDPRGTDEKVVAVKLDSDRAICAICEAGIHIGNLEPV